MDELPPADIRWRCRRGMRELDVLLNRWMDHAWHMASEDEQAAFRELLDAEDDQLWNWLLGRSEPPAAHLRLIVHAIRTRSVEH